MLLAMVATLAAAPALAEPELEISGFVESETRAFLDAPQFADQDRGRVQPSIAGEAELKLYWETETLTLVPFARYDPADHEGRTHWDLREANLYLERNNWDATIGLGKVFWGVVESRHLVDIINQTDLVENTDEEEKLGQPMINVNWLTDFGTISGFVLPGFRERTFPGDDARFRGPLAIDVDNPVYESGAEEKHVDFALRYSHSIDEWDIGVAHFHGTSREPVLAVGTNDAGNAVLIPTYLQINQTSMDIQGTFDEWLWKLETFRRSGQGDVFFAATGGFEYSFYGLNDTAHDLGILLEYHYDGRGTGAPATLFDQDIFVGARYVLNDEQSTELLAGAIIDRDDQETLFSVEAERRIGQDWKAEVEGTFLTNIKNSSGLSGVREDSNVLFRLARFF